MGKKVLIATLYNADPVLLAANRLGPDRLILLTNKKSDDKQVEAYKLIKDSLGRIIDVKEVKIEVYDIVDVARKCVEIIDMQPAEDHLFINVTAGRKTQALGLLYAAYCRIDRISRIAYNPEEDRTSVVYLPKMGFKLNESQKKILEVLDSGDFKAPSDMADKVEMSKAMLYRTLDELRDLGYIETEDGFKLTDAGKIARL